MGDRLKILSAGSSLCLQVIRAALADADLAPSDWIALQSAPRTAPVLMGFIIWWGIESKVEGCKLA